jgi:ankyrin repeat protein
MLNRTTISGLCLASVAVLGLGAFMIASSGDTRVADAAQAGNAEAVRTLLKQAVDVNAAQGDGMTALHWAALKGEADMAKVLLYAGANVRATTRLAAYTPLFMAAKSGNATVVKVLLDAGADAKTAALDGLTPLMMAASSGDAESVNLLIGKGADPNVRETENGQTAMGFAAAFNRPDAIKALLQRGANIDLASKVQQPPAPPQRGAFGNFAQGQGGQAAAQGQGQGAQAAAQGGRGGRGGRGAAAAPPAAGTAPTPAAPAAANAQPPAQGGGQQQAQTQAQMNGADATGRGGGNPRGGYTPLMYAARQGGFDAAKILVDSGAKLNEVSGDHSTALVLGIINGHFDIAKMLVDHGADVNIASVDGATPLFVVVNTQWARKSFHPQPTTKYEKTGYMELMATLLDRGANPNARLTKELWFSEFNFSLESSSSVGVTPFWKCAEVGDIDGMKFLVSRGADPDIASVDGVTPLLMASGAGTHGNDDVTAPPGRLAAVKYLVEELHADVNAADNPPAGGGRGGGGGANIPQIAYQLAQQANNGKEPTQAQIDEQTKFLQQQQAMGGFGGSRGGSTALHNAAQRGDNEMILYLVSKGAKVNAVTKGGSTVVDMANGPRQRLQPYPETVALLEMLGAANSHKCVSC